MLRIGVRRDRAKGDRLSRRAGQELVELGLVIPILALVTMLILEFGRMFMLMNMVTSATRDEARLAAVSPIRAANCFPTAVIKPGVGQQALGTTITGSGNGNYGLSSMGLSLNVAPSRPVDAGSGVYSIQVETTGNIDFLFFPGSITIDRASRYRDEFSQGPSC
jgi:Flp pilus assembly protein TadG